MKNAIGRFENALNQSPLKGKLDGLHKTIKETFNAMVIGYNKLDAGNHKYTKEQLNERRSNFVGILDILVVQLDNCPSDVDAYAKKLEMDFKPIFEENIKDEANIA